MSNQIERELLFGELMARHVDLVFHVARSLCRGDAAAAEELTQLTFVKAYRAFGRFEPGTSFKAWVLTILRRAHVDAARASARAPTPLGPGEEPTLEADACAPPPRAVDLESREVFYDLFGDEVARLLRRLPEDHQVAVLLADVEGLTYREVADVLGCPVGTVRSRIHRGRALLQELLVDYARRLGYARERVE